MRISKRDKLVQFQAQSTSCNIAELQRSCKSLCSLYINEGGKDLSDKGIGKALGCYFSSLVSIPSSFFSPAQTEQDS